MNRPSGPVDLWPIEYFLSNNLVKGLFFCRNQAVRLVFTGILAKVKRQCPLLFLSPAMTALPIRSV